MLRRQITLPIMGCGTWAWGNRLLWGYDTSMDNDLQAVFNLCVSNGVTLFDTGDSYGTGKLNGRSEQLLGQFSQAYSTNSNGANKENICIATKLAAYPWRLTRQSMVTAGKMSAKRLGRNIDLVQMHWSTANYAPWQEPALLNGLADLYEQGLVRGVGLSNYGTKRLKWAHKLLCTERGVPITTLQVQYSLLSTYPVTELGLKEVCDELGIKIIAYSPLALGLLTGKYSESSYPKGIRGLACRQILPGMKPLLECMQEISQTRNKTLAQIAINWCIAKGTIPIPGAKSPHQAQQNIGAIAWLLSDAEVEELDKIAASLNKKMVQNIFQTK
ncbi:oxidoreductase [Dulcicalothrix desertica PCC 7102]|uniref:Oxidoreductase n=1 Tax=Dulcicalothrix desertica PCC 7102 TaxID=232991 RepID=A0A3S1J068_9CYAN|nr:aldo/keto reductase [Dulcicalothrix desertica]RUT05311.1 oxidoreductase [Dulcicalothrix desertica PCC 7102]TWH43193.1 pyridoxine 4-dehydrogenase [Dulcicalothrix desertica PCC 7102]